MRRLAARGLALGLILLAASPTPAEEAAPESFTGPAAAPAVQATRTAAGGAERLDVELPGVLLGATALPAGEGFGAGRLLLLVGGEGDPDARGSLFVLDPASGTLAEAASDLPAGGKAIEVIDLDGDDTGEVLLGRLGDLFLLGSWAGGRLVDGPNAAGSPSEGSPGGVPAVGAPPEAGSLPAVSPSAASAPVEEPAPRHLLRHAGFDLRSLSPRLLRRARLDRRWLAVAEVGALRLYEADRYALDSRGGLALARELPLPVRAAREAAGLRLTSPPVALLAAGPDGGWLAAAGPEAHAPRRLRTVLLEPAAAAGEDGAGGGRSEAWAVLPGPEVVEQSWIARVDGRPVLFVATQSADRIGIFEHRQLRVFPLSADPTREGRRPSLAVETRSRRWFQMGLEIDDLDGDGRDDLLLIQPEGLGGGELLLEIFPGIGSGRFVTRTRKTKLEVGAERWAFGGDADGDGLPDLAVATGDALALYPGSPSKRRLVEKTPRWSLPLAGAAETERQVVEEGGDEEHDGEKGGSGHRSSTTELEMIDLDGDGRAEVLLLTSDRDGRGRLTLVRSVE